MEVEEGVEFLEVAEEDEALPGQGQYGAMWLRQYWTQEANDLEKNSKINRLYEKGSVTLKFRREAEALVCGSNDNILPTAIANITG